MHEQTDIMDLDGVYVTKLPGPVSGYDLCRQKHRGVQIRLYTDDPDVVIAPGGDEVFVLIGWGQWGRRLPRDRSLSPP